MDRVPVNRLLLLRGTDCGLLSLVSDNDAAASAVVRPTPPPQYSSDYEHKGGGIAQGVPTTANNSPPPRPETQPATINPTDKLPRRAAVACRRVIYDNLVLSLTGGT